MIRIHKMMMMTWLGCCSIKELSHNKILISLEITDFISNLVIPKYKKYFTDVNRLFNHAYFTNTMTAYLFLFHCNNNLCNGSY